MPTRWTRRWKRGLGVVLPFLFTECPSGTDHWFFERWCLCEYQDVPGEDAPGEDAPGEDDPDRNDALGPGHPDHEQHDGGSRGGVFDLKRWEKARQGPAGYRPGNTNVQIGDYVQPEGLELRPPLAWRVVGFEAQGRNPKYIVILEYPLSGDRLPLENLPRHTRPPGNANDPERLGRLSEVQERRAAA